MDYGGQKMEVKSRIADNYHEDTKNTESLIIGLTQLSF